MMIGEQGTSRKRAIFISGQMAFISTSGVMMRNNLFLSLFVMTNRDNKGFLAIERWLSKNRRTSKKLRIIMFPYTIFDYKLPAIKWRSEASFSLINKKNVINFSHPSLYTFRVNNKVFDHPAFTFWQNYRLAV